MAVPWKLHPPRGASQEDGRLHPCTLDDPVRRLTDGLTWLDLAIAGYSSATLISLYSHLIEGVKDHLRHDGTLLQRVGDALFAA